MTTTLTNAQVELIARVAHEANRAYCATHGDDSQPAWSDAPDWQRGSAINGVRFHLAAHARGETPPPSASHDSWKAQKEAEGWTYGLEKNPEKKTHPCMRPFDELPEHQRLKDHLFGHVVAAFVDGLGLAAEDETPTPTLRDA